MRWLLVLFAIVFVLTVAPSNLTPLMLVRSFPSGEQGNVVNLAILEMSFSVGMVVGGVLVSTLASGWNRIALIAGSSLVFGALAIGLGLAPTLWVFFGVMLLVGVAVPFFSTPSMTLLQETVEPERQGRVFGFVGIVMALAMPFGMLVFGPLADAFRIESILVGAGIRPSSSSGLALGLPAGRRAIAAAHARRRAPPTRAQTARARRPARARNPGSAVRPSRARLPVCAAPGWPCLSGTLPLSLAQGLDARSVLVAPSHGQRGELVRDRRGQDLVTEGGHPCGPPGEIRVAAACLGDDVKGAEAGLEELVEGFGGRSDRASRTAARPAHRAVAHARSIVVRRPALPPRPRTRHRDPVAHRCLPGRSQASPGSAVRGTA